MRKALYLFCGVCWLAFGPLIGAFVFQYLAEGAGLQESGFFLLIFYPLFASGTIVLGLMHLIGLTILSPLLCAIGFCLCLRAYDPPPPPTQREQWRAARREWNRQNGPASIAAQLVTKDFSPWPVGFRLVFQLR